jgi:hypothetical protein
MKLAQTAAYGALFSAYLLTGSAITVSKEIAGGLFDRLHILGYSDIPWGAVRLTQGGPMRVMKVAQDRHIVLPKRLFQPADTVLVLTEGDTVVIKKVRSRLSSVAQRVRGRALSMPTIVREVRAHRKHRRQA